MTSLILISNNSVFTAQKKFTETTFVMDFTLQLGEGFKRQKERDWEVFASCNFSSDKQLKK